MASRHHAAMSIAEAEIANWPDSYSGAFRIAAHRPMQSAILTDTDIWLVGQLRRPPKLPCPTRCSTRPASAHAQLASGITIPTELQAVRISALLLVKLMMAFREATLLLHLAVLHAERAASVRKHIDVRGAAETSHGACSLCQHQLSLCQYMSSISFCQGPNTGVVWHAPPANGPGY